MLILNKLLKGFGCFDRTDIDIMSIFSGNFWNNDKKHRYFKQIATVICIVFGVFVFYTATVGLVPAIARHSVDGRIQWLKSNPGIVEVLQVYEYPACFLAKVPIFRTFFELSADFWFSVTNAPETT